MKKIMSVFAVCLTCCSAAVFASSDIYLKITDAQGASQIVKCPDGACVVNNLKKGKYDLTVEDRSSQKTAKDEAGARKSAIDPIEFSASVVSPRDASTGLATGRRQYAPVIIRKEMVAGAQIVVAEDGSTLSVVGVAGVASSSQPVVQPAAKVDLPIATKVEPKVK